MLNQSAWLDLLDAGGWLLLPLFLLALISWGSILSTWWNLRACRKTLISQSSSRQSEWKHFVLSGGDSRTRRQGQSDLLLLSGLERFDRSLQWSAILVAAAPLTGLLGTVLGMITTFMGLGGGSFGSPIDEVSRGISQALLTTQIGLLVAIPGTLLLALAHRDRLRFERDWAHWSQSLYPETSPTAS